MHRLPSDILALIRPNESQVRGASLLETVYPGETSAARNLAGYFLGKEVAQRGLDLSLSCRILLNAMRGNRANNLPAALRALP
jgi:hypothetical protein